uniref:Uncharacterized protein n=1 Tax=Clostridium perfringens TaxID=1502 RepID=G5DSD3_CLOPF|nr:hypothetical protein pMini_001 [Clostridium perfringens]
MVNFFNSYLYFNILNLNIYFLYQFFNFIKKLSGFICSFFFIKKWTFMDTFLRDFFIKKSSFFFS